MYSRSELEKFSIELSDDVDNIMEDGVSFNSALNTAHDNLKKRIGAEGYNQFEAFLNENCEPYG